MLPETVLSYLNKKCSISAKQQAGTIYPRGKANKSTVTENYKRHSLLLQIFTPRIDIFLNALIKAPNNGAK